MSVDVLRHYVEEILATYRFPGLSVAVTDRDGLLASEQFGLANLDAGIAVSRETAFEFGSIGKVFTALILLQEHERGRVDLDAPLTEYLPWFEVRSEHAPITIRHVLTHSSGLMVGAEMSADSRFDVWALRETEVAFPPGSRYLYSNVGYRALGFVVEKLVFEPYWGWLLGAVLAPLGLEAIEPVITNEGRPRLAVGYERLFDDRPARRDDPWVPATWLETGTGDGSQAGRVDDLAAFLRVLLNRGEGVISPESFELMITPAIEADDGWWYGCGLELRGTEIRHGGSMPGFGATMLGDVEAGLGVAVAVNAADEQDVTEEIAEALLALYRDGVPPSVADPLAVEDAVDYAGIYVDEVGNDRLVIEAEGDRLFLEGMPLEPRRPDRFLVDDPRFALFLLGFNREDGRVVEATHGGDVYRREDAAAAVLVAVPAGWSALPGHYRAYNPWYSNFRVVLRGGELLVALPWGAEWPLTPLPDGAFRVAEDWSAERVRFDAIVDGTALRADFSGESYYRMP